MTDHHDDQPPRKLSKAECGRLGGLQTKARHGRDHYVRAGKLGFAAFARQKGFMGGSRLEALRWLARHGKVAINPEETRRHDEAYADLARQLGLEGTDHAD